MCSRLLVIIIVLFGSSSQVFSRVLPCCKVERCNANACCQAKERPEATTCCKAKENCEAKACCETKENCEAKACCETSECCKTEKPAAKKCVHSATLIVMCDENAKVVINNRRTKTKGTARQYTVQFYAGDYTILITQKNPTTKKGETRSHNFSIRPRIAPQVIHWDSCLPVKEQKEDEKPKTSCPVCAANQAEKERAEKCKACKKAPQAWPGSAEGVVFSWADGAPINIKKGGKAHINDAGIMDLNYGSISPIDFNGKLFDACQNTNELSIEVVFTSASEKQFGPARIVSFSKDINSRNFTLGQEGNRLVLRLRTLDNDENANKIVVDLVEIKKDRPMHLIVAYKPGKTVCYVNGDKAKCSGILTGNLSNWEPMKLIFGDEVTGDPNNPKNPNNRNWNGTIERVAIGSKFIDAAAAKHQHELWQNEKK